MSRAEIRAAARAGGRKVPHHVARVKADLAREATGSARAAAAPGSPPPSGPPKGRRVWPYVAAGGAVVGAGGLVALRSSRKKDTVGKSLYAVPVSKGAFGNAARASLKGVRTNGLKAQLKSEVSGAKAAYKTSYDTAFRATSGGLPSKYSKAMAPVGSGLATRRSATVMARRGGAPAPHLGDGLHDLVSRRPDLGGKVRAFRGAKAGGGWGSDVGDHMAMQTQRKSTAIDRLLAGQKSSPPRARGVGSYSVTKALTQGQSNAIVAGGLVGGALVGEVGGRAIGRRRYNKGKERPNALMRYGSIDRGWTNAALKDKGVVRKASRDENSSVGVSISRTGPCGPHRASQTAAVGRNQIERGNPVGQRSSRDENSSPGATKVIARTPQGKFVSHENDLDVFHVKPRRRTDSRLMHYGKKGTKLP